MPSRAEYLDSIRAEANKRFNYESEFFCSHNADNLLIANAAEWDKLIAGSKDVNLSTADLYYCRLGLMAMYLGRESEMPGFANTPIYRSVQGKRILSMRAYDDVELPSFVFDDFDQNLFLEALKTMHEGRPSIKLVEENYLMKQKSRRDSGQGWFVNDDFETTHKPAMDNLFSGFLNVSLDEIVGVVIYPHKSARGFEMKVTIIYESGYPKNISLPMKKIDGVNFSIGRHSIDKYGADADINTIRELYNGIILYDRNGQVVTRQAEYRIDSNNDALINERIRIGNKILNYFRDNVDNHLGGNAPTM